LVNSQVPFQKKENHQRKNDLKHYFCGCLTHKHYAYACASHTQILWPQTLVWWVPFLQVHMPASFEFAYADPVTQHYRQRRVWKVPLLATMESERFTYNSVHPAIDESKWKGKWANTLCFQWYLTFSKLYIYITFQAKDSVRSTSAIFAVTIKPWPGAIANCHLRSYGERKRTQRRNKKNKGSTIMHTL